MNSKIQYPIVLLALGSALLGGCSGGGGGGAVNVHKLTPNVLDSEIPTEFQVSGTDYAPVGGTALVRLVAAAGTPFQAGTTGEVSLDAIIESPTLLRGTTMPFGVTGTVPVNVTVLLPDGEIETTTATVQGPTLSAFEPEGIVSGLEKDFTLRGSGFGDVGATVGVRFTAAVSTPFQDGTSATLIALAEVVSSTSVQGTIPSGSVEYAATATVEVGFPSGARTAPAPVFVEFAPELELWASDGASEDQFGESVALSDGGAIVGAPQDDDLGSGSGAAYVFSELSAPWTDQVKLLPADGATGDNFGHAIARTNARALVGAPRNNGPALDIGAAYVFGLYQGAWTEEAKLVPESGPGGNHFGFSVCLSEDTAIVGSPLREANPASSGSVHVFSRGGTIWTEEQRLQPPAGQDCPGFGFSMAVSGDTLVVGGLTQDVFGDTTGKAFVFVRSGSVWTYQATLTPDSGQANDVFGYRVAISGETAVVTAFGDEDLGPISGAAYVFVREGTTWTQAQKLIASDGGPTDFFGMSAAISGDTLMIGATNASTDWFAGSVYVFKRQEDWWSEWSKLQPATAEEGAHFGASIALTPGCVLVGAPDSEAASSDYGQAYIF